MTFHEKSRWIALGANLIVWSWYFVTVARALRAGFPDAPYFMAMMIPVIIALAIIHIVGHTIAALMNPKEASADTDERERAVGQRAAVWGYHLLCVGIFLVVGGSLFWWNTFLVVNGILFAFIIAECVRYAIEIAAYRRMAS
jgi:hypothetical protein